MIAWFLGLLSSLWGKWREYLIIGGVSLLIVLSAYLKGYWDGRMAAQPASKAREGEARLIHDTQIITKVIHDSKDTCAGAAVPAAVLKQLR